MKSFPRGELLFFVWISDRTHAAIAFKVGLSAQEKFFRVDFKRPHSFLQCDGVKFGGGKPRTDAFADALCDLEDFVDGAPAFRPLPAAAVAARSFRELNNTVCLAPALISTKGDMDELLRALDAALASL